MLPRPLLLAGCFILAMFAGWTARNARTRQPAEGKQASPLSATTPTSSTMPDGMDDKTARLWLADHLSESSSEQLADIAARLGKIPELSSKAWQGLLLCWFEKDPAAAWAFASTKPDLRLIALEQWACLDPAASRSVMDSTSKEDWEALMNGATGKDVVEAFRLLDEAVEEGFDVKGLYHSQSGLRDWYFTQLAVKDPDAAAMWVERLGIELESIKGAILWGRLKNDPAATKEWLSQQQDRAIHLTQLAAFARGSDSYQPAVIDLIAEGLPPGNARLEAIQGILNGLSWRDPEFAAKEAARVLPDPSVRADVIANIASLIADTDFNKAWSLLEALGPSVQGNQRRSIPEVDVHDGSGSGALQPPANYWSGFMGPEGQTPDSVKSFLLDCLMESDKDQAIHLMDEIPATGFLTVGGDAFHKWASHSPDEAIHWLAGKLGTESGQVKDTGKWNFIESLLTELSPEKQDAFIASLPPGSVRTVLVAKHAKDMAWDDPLAALKYARETDTADQSVVQAYSVWAACDAAEALSHLSEDASAPVGAWTEATDMAYEDGPAEFTEALLTAPASVGRDAAILKILESGARENSGALALAIGDDIQRRDAFEKVLTGISMDPRLAHDPATESALRKQLEEATGISEAARHQLTERINLEFTDQ